MQAFEHLDEPAIAHLALNAEAIEYSREFAQTVGIEWLCTPFTPADADMLAEMGERRIKLSSRVMHEPEFLRYVSELDFDGIIMSTGGATLDDVHYAVRTLAARHLTLLQCTRAYPADDGDANLAVMDAYRTIGFVDEVGYSDHCLGIEVAIGAAWGGADVIENHFTYDRHAVGPDHAVSADPIEFKAMVAGIRYAERVRGDGIKRLMGCER
jgi:sialic acid synthase SpsE